MPIKRYKPAQIVTMLRQINSGFVTIFGFQRATESWFGPASRAVFGDGHTSDFPIRPPLSRKSGWKSGWGSRMVCDEKNAECEIAEAGRAAASPLIAKSAMRSAPRTR